MPMHFMQSCYCAVAIPTTILPSFFFLHAEHLRHDTFPMLPEFSRTMGPLIHFLFECAFLIARIEDVTCAGPIA